MSIVKVTLPPGEIPVEGKQVSFKAPCTCDQTEAIQIEGVDYTVCDALGKCVTGIGGVWDVDSIVSVILSPEQRKAYIQNNAGYSPTNKPTFSEIGMVTGSYSGDNADSRTISLGFTPKFVMVSRGGSQFYNGDNRQTYGAFAVQGYTGNIYGLAAVRIVNGGFTVYNNQSSSSSGYNETVCLNTKSNSTSYNYIALA
jgi:hypothetical protein